MEKINIAYILSTLQICGPINQTLNLISCLDLTKFNPIVITISPEQNNSLLDIFVEKKITIIQLDLPRWAIISPYFLLKKFLKKNNIDIVHSQGMRSDIISYLIKKNEILITTTRSAPYKTNLIKYGKFISSIATKIQYQSFQYFDKIVVPSNALYEQIHPYVSCLSIQNGVDTDRFYPLSSDKKKNLKKELGLNSNSKIYLCLGDLIPRKNVKLAIEAFNKLQYKKDLILLIVGDGIECEILKKYSRNNNNIYFLGLKKDPLPYLQVSDFIISTALSEGLPNSILESVACGLVPILSDIKPHLEILSELNGIGYSFNNQSIDSLIKVIEQTLDLDINGQIQQIRSISLQKFSKNIMAQSYQKLYTELYYSKINC